MAFKVARFLDVSEGIQANQFTIGSRDTLNSLDDIDPIYRPLLDSPVPAIFTVMGSDGRANMTPMWFDYEGANVGSVGWCKLYANRRTANSWVCELG